MPTPRTSVAKPAVPAVVKIARKLTSKSYVRKQDYVLLGLLNEFFASEDQIGIIPSNFDNDAVSVMFVIKYEDGDDKAVIATKELSAMLRAKTISMSEVYGFEVFETLTPEGEILNLVCLPQDESKAFVGIKSGAVTAKAFTRAPKAVRTFQQSINMG